MTKRGIDLDYHTGYTPSDKRINENDSPSGDLKSLKNRLWDDSDVVGTQLHEADSRSNENTGMMNGDENEERGSDLQRAIEESVLQGANEESPLARENEESVAHSSSHGENEENNIVIKGLGEPCIYCDVTRDKKCFSKLCDVAFCRDCGKDDNYILMMENKTCVEEDSNSFYCEECFCFLSKPNIRSSLNGPRTIKIVLDRTKMDLDGQKLGATLDNTLTSRISGVDSGGFAAHLGVKAGDIIRLHLEPANELSIRSNLIKALNNWFTDKKEPPLFLVLERPANISEAGTTLVSNYMLAHNEASASDGRKWFSPLHKNSEIFDAIRINRSVKLPHVLQKTRQENMHRHSPTNVRRKSMKKREKRTEVALFSSPVRVQQRVYQKSTHFNSQLLSLSLPKQCSDLTPRYIKETHKKLLEHLTECSSLNFEPSVRGLKESEIRKKGSQPSDEEQAEVLLKILELGYKKGKAGNSRIAIAAANIVSYNNNFGECFWKDPAHQVQRIHKKYKNSKGRLPKSEKGKRGRKTQASLIAVVEFLQLYRSATAILGRKASFSELAQHMSSGYNVIHAEDGKISLLSSSILFCPPFISISRISHSVACLVFSPYLFFHAKYHVFIRRR